MKTIVGQNTRAQIATGRSVPSSKERAFDLPFDELDPCCQKEIVNANHHERVGLQLRQHDRSQVRIDERMKAFNSLRQGFGCICGSTNCIDASGDYPLLQLLRASKSEDAMFGQMESETTKEPETCSDSDDDSLLDGLGTQFLTAEEQERLNEVSERLKVKEQAKKMGYAQHIMDNPIHLRALIDGKQLVVLHVCDINSILCAGLDLALEKLASIYIGTMFRRILLSPDTTHFLESELEKQSGALTSTMRLKEGLPSILCFKDGMICAIESFLGQFGVEESICEADLLRYLQNTHVLSADVAELSFEKVKGILEAEAAQEEEEPDESYCGHEGCARKYAHSHVSGGADSLVKSEKEQGIEALADNVFTRM